MSASDRHPRGLYPLFFTEMWERHSFYIVAFTLLFYLTETVRGALGMPAARANEIVGTYLAFVYFTPFLGGLIADRYLGYRRAVLVGGICMAAGLFFVGSGGIATLVPGLALVCIGNGFFKPNISVMVGNLYAHGDPKRDAGFNIFYMGINIGAFLASFTAAWVRNAFGWGWMFRAAGIGLLIGCAILLLYWKRLAAADRQPGTKAGDTQLSEMLLKIFLPAGLFGAAGFFAAETFLPAGFAVGPIMCGFLAGMVPVLVFFVRLAVTAAPDERPGLVALLPVFVAGATFFMILHLNSTALATWAKRDTERHTANPWTLFPGTAQPATPDYFGNAGPEVPRPDERTLVAVGEREALLWDGRKVGESMVATLAAGSPGLRLRELSPGAATPTALQVFRDDQLSVTGGSAEQPLRITIDPAATPVRHVELVREIDGRDVPVQLVTGAAREAVYRRAGEARLPLDGSLPVTNPEMFTQANAFFVVALTPLVVAFFQWLVHRRRGISTPRKIFYGLLLTAASMLLMVLAGALSDGGTAKVSWLWLVSAYGIVTLGELCLSPMGLSLVTKLSPPRLVGLMMGGWFVATAFGNKLSGFLGGIQASFDPIWFFLLLAGVVTGVAFLIRLVVPRMEAALDKYGA
jgi:POT family proton-dependent oligopeptide transporter